MIHTNKIVRVPYEMTQVRKPVDSIIDNLEHEMNTIMSNKTLPTDVKLAKYNNILQKFNKMIQKKQQPYEIVIEGEKESSYTDEAILEGIPHDHVYRAKSLLKHVHNNPNIKINDTGEVILDGRIIRGSNIKDIIHDFSRQSRSRPPAVGAESFASVLQRFNIPIESIGNQNRLNLFKFQPGVNWDE